MRKTKRFFSILSFLLASGLWCIPLKGWGQQETIFSLYRNHLNLHNPAGIGLSNTTEINLSIRSQWVGVEDAPEAQAFTFSLPNPKKRLHLGLSILNDRTFVERYTQFNIDFSYALPMENNTNVFLGLKAGGSSIGLNLANLATFEGEQADPNLVNRSGLTPNLGVGFHLQSPRFFLAASIPRVLNTERFSSENERVSLATDRPHIYFNTAYRFSISKRWEIIPTLLWTSVKGAPSTTQVDLLLVFENQFEFGPIIQTNNGLGMSLGLWLKDFMQLSYAYTNGYGNHRQQFSTGSHEIGLKVQFGAGENKGNSSTHHPLFSSSTIEDISEEKNKIKELLSKTNKEQNNSKNRK